MCGGKKIYSSAELRWNRRIIVATCAAPLKSSHQGISLLFTRGRMRARPFQGHIDDQGNTKQDDRHTQH